MRRPAFLVLLIIITIILMLDSLNIPLTHDGLINCNDFDNICYGKVENIEFKDEYTRFEIKLTDDYGGNTAESKALITVYDDNTEDIAVKYEKYNYLLNCIVSFESELSVPDKARNPNCFDYRRYLKSKGIYLTGTTEKFDIVEDNINIFQRYEKMLFEKKYQFSQRLSDTTRGIIMGMSFGDKTFMDDDIYDDFRKNGTAHILSVSGLHIGLLYSLFVRIYGNSFKAKQLVLLIVVMLSYGILSNWSPSVIRAEMMIFLKISADKLYLRYDLLNALSVTGIIMIVFNPYIIFGASFQMSFLAIMSLSFFVPFFKDRVSKIFISSLSVNFGLLVYQIYSFNYFSWTSVFANIPVIFLASIAVPLVLLSFVFFSLFGNDAFTKFVIDDLSYLIVKVNCLSTLDGKGSIETASPGLGITMLISCLLLFFVSEYFYILLNRKKHTRVILTIMIIIAFSSVTGSAYYSCMSRDDLIFVDVGQGDCIHINNGKIDVLIDGGGKYSYNVGEKLLKSYLLKNGNADIDLAILTHEHMDHKKGIDELNASSYKVRKIESKCTIGREWTISDNLYIKTLWPIKIDDNEEQDENESCSVFMIYYNGYKILVTGDMDEKGERKMLQYYDNSMLKADILKVGHHGSRTSTSDEFLKAVDPDYAVIQVGKNNYGHPSKEIIEKMKYLGIIVFDTLESGAIGFRLDRNRIAIHEMNP